jgi:hypothetical protein
VSSFLKEQYLFFYLFVFFIFLSKKNDTFKLNFKTSNTHSNLKNNMKLWNKVSKEELFWNFYSKKNKISQLQRYENHNSPNYIKKFIELGGGSNMGITLEHFARYSFPSLQKKPNCENNTGYDHIIYKNSNFTKEKQEIFVEQKTSGFWKKDDFRWQHIAPNHKWDILLLCGIGYTKVHFWVMNRETFNQLVNLQNITIQGSKKNNSDQGMWCNYSVIKNYLVEISNDNQLIQYINKQK